MNTDEIIFPRWYADASAVQFLDLSVREFHVKKKITLISALDLSAAPRIYAICPDWFHDVPIMLKYGITGLREFNPIYCDFNIPSVPLIEIFGAFENENCDLPDSFFDDFSRYILEKLEKKWELETMRLYINHLLLYIHYSQNALFYLNTGKGSEWINFDRPLTYIHHACRPIRLIKEVTPKFIKLMFDNTCPHSITVAQFCFNQECLEDLLFRYEPEITDYVLHHFRKVKRGNINWRDFRPYLETYGGCVNPEIFRVLVNYGAENFFKKLWNNHFYKLYLPKRRSIPRHLKHFMKAVQRACAKPDTRESEILRMLNCYFNSPFAGFPWFLKVQRIIWKTMPFPLITHQEMKDATIKFFGNQFAEDISDELRNFFDGFETVLQPNSLLHFCRCVIRHKLNSTSQMPEGIGCLGLPNRLQSYLKLEL